MTLSSATLAARPSPSEAAIAELEAMREACLRRDGGCAVLRGLHHCALHGIAWPSWLSEEYMRRYLMVGDAWVGSWDEAFGRPYPPRTRLTMVRRRRKLWFEVHAAVWSELQSDPSRAIDRALFEAASRRLGYLSGGSVRNYYYEAINEGQLLNLSVWKASVMRQRKADALTPSRPLPVFALERLNGRGDAAARP